MKKKKENNTNYVSASFDGLEGVKQPEVTYYDTGTLEVSSYEQLELLEDYKPLLTFRPPVYVGALTIVEGFEVNVPKKPNFIHRWFMRLLLGWKWEDKK